MKAIYIAYTFLIFFLGACGPSSTQIQAQTASALASAVNATLPVLVEAYKKEGMEVIMRAQDMKTAELNLKIVEKNWGQIWDAWTVLRVADDTWVETIQNRGDVESALVSVKNAYCGLMTIWPNSVPARPVALVKCGAGK